jgi:hypothetical protein
MKIMKTLSTALCDDYVVELLSEQNDRDCLIGWGPDLHAAHRCYHAATTKYPNSTVRLRQGAQPIALRVPKYSVARSRMH